MAVEIELKLSIDADAVDFIARHPAVLATKEGRTRRTRLVSVYYDTPDLALAAAGVAVRVRRDGRRFVQTIKGPARGDSGAGLHARPEFEFALTGRTLDPALFGETPYRRVVRRATRESPLAERFTTDFIRRSVPLAFEDGTKATLCIDVGTIAPHGGGASAPIAEVEIELESGRAAPLFEFARTLAADLPLRVATITKAERGYAIVRGEAESFCAPVRARGVALDAKMTPSAALAAVARECADQIAGNATGVIADEDPEWIHQMRVGTRRLRSCLRLLADHLDTPERLLPLGGEIRWLAEVAGQARDWDVFVLETLPPMIARFDSDDALAASFERLLVHAEARRRRARAAARAAVASPRFTQMLLDLLALLASAEEAPDTDHRGARRYADAILARLHRRVARRGERLPDASAEERHALRIVAKKMRYAAEFFAPLYPEKRARAWLKALARVQDVLGRGNDAVTAMHRAAEVGAGAMAAAGAVRGIAVAQGDSIAAELSTAWKKFARAPAFWRRSPGG